MSEDEKFKEVALKDWGHSWQDSWIFGGVYINCACGNRIEDETYDAQTHEPIVCNKCDRRYRIRVGRVWMEVEEK